MPKRKNTRKRTGKASKQPARKKTGGKQALPRIIPYAILGIAIIGTILIRMQFLDLPFDRDEGTYIYAGQQILDGATPYIDFYELKPPAIFYSYVFLIGLFGSSVIGMHLAFMAVVVLTQVLLFFLLKPYAGTLGGALAALVYGFLSFIPSMLGFGALSEHLLNLFLVLSLVLLQKGISKKHNIWLITAGFAFAWMILIKQTAMLFIPLFLMVLWMAGRKADLQTIRQYVKPLGFVITGGLIPAVLFSLLMLIQGSFDEFLFWNLEWPRIAYSSTMDLEDGRITFNHNFGRIWREISYVLLFAGASLITGLINKNTRKPTLLLLVWLVCASLFIIPGYRFYAHYWLVFLPVIGALCGLGVQALVVLTKKRFSPVLASVAGTAIVAGILALQFSTSLNEYIGVPAAQLMRYCYGDNPFPEVKILSDYLDNQMDAGDTFMVFGSEPEAYVYLDRASPVRHIFTNMIMKPSQYSVTFQEEVWKTYEKLEPDYVIWSQHIFSWGMKPGSDDRLYNRGYRAMQQQYDRIAVAEISNQPTSYFYGENARSREPQTKYWVAVFKRQ